jgi:hypothetical protein
MLNKEPLDLAFNMRVEPNQRELNSTSICEEDQRLLVHSRQIYGYFLGKNLKCRHIHVPIYESCQKIQTKFMRLCKI